MEPLSAARSIYTNPIYPTYASIPGADRVHIWFDLGDVLVGPPSGSEGSEGDTLRFLPGAFAYLQALLGSGFAVGIIANIPESWGNPGDYDSKLTALKDFVASAWDDPTHPFDWSKFDHILLPLWENERKPADALFQDAQAISSAEGKVGFYQGGSGGNDGAGGGQPGDQGMP